MEHSTIEEQAIVERYVRGTLSAEEEERFEAHFMECARCQEELETARSFTRGMKRVAAEEAARSAMRSGLLVWLVRRRAAAGAVALALIGLVLGTGYLLRENRQLEIRLVELARPAELPVVLLGVVRSEETPTTVSDTGEPWSLAVDAGADPRIESYAVSILDAEGEVRFEREGLSPNVLEVIQLTFPSGFLPPGEYRLEVRGILAGESVELGTHPFRIETPG